ncbi:MAG: hypothetical protein ACFFG0_30300 [Candidatus Thorarchaeota archaeon]
MIQQLNLLKKNGFYEVLEILSLKGNAMNLNRFFRILFKNKSYYNAFYRVKEEMLEKGLIEIYYFHNYGKNNKTTRMIKLTSKGISIKRYLNSIKKVLMA